MPENCPACNHPQHAAGTECTGGVSHGPKHFHRCLCLNRPGADRACPPLMQCMGGELGYADLYYLQQGRTVYGTGGKVYTPSLLRGEGSRHVGYRSWVSPHMLRCLEHAPEGSHSPFDWRRVTVSDVEASDLRRTCSYMRCGVDVLEASKGYPPCVCDEPATPDTVHRTDGPCYVDARPEPADRSALSARLWATAEHHIVAEWICCEPLDPKHELCARGYEALRMVRALLVDSPEAWNPEAPLLNAVLAVLPVTVDRAAIDRVRALHAPDENGECLGCGSSFDPCPTIAVIDGPSGVADEDVFELPGPEVVAYRNSDRPGVLLCREHGDGWWGLTPLTSDDLPDGGTCTYGDPADPDDVCGVDVLIPQQQKQQKQQTPCSQPNACDADTGELCGVHEEAQAHADGEHEYCGVTCEVEFTSEKLRNTILYRAIPGSGNMLKELLRRAANRSALMEAHIALAEQAGKDQRELAELKARMERLEK